MRRGATPVLAHGELTSDTYDDIRFQRVLVQEMGELLPANLLAECGLSRVGSVVNAVPSEQVWPSDVSTCPPI